jgi:hypothetical protein
MTGLPIRFNDLDTNEPASANLDTDRAPIMDASGGPLPLHRPLIGGVHMNFHGPVTIGVLRTAHTSPSATAAKNAVASSSGGSGGACSSAAGAAPSKPKPVTSQSTAAIAASLPASDGVLRIGCKTTVITRPVKQDVLTFPTLDDDDMPA